MTNEPSLDDQISIYIGRAARQTVELELSLQRGYKELKRQPYNEPGPEGVNVLINECIAALPASDFPIDLRDAAFDALGAARSANRRRNRVVHDLWRPSPEDPQTYVAVKFDDGDRTPQVPSLTVEEFARSVDEMKIANHRVSRLYWITAAARENWPQLPRGEHDVLATKNQKVLRGEFRLNEAGEAEWDS
jgi:hypothetical protein